MGFVGNNGTLVVDRNGWEVIPEVLNNKPQMEKVELQPASGKGLEMHLQNFVDCVKDKSLVPRTGIAIAANTARVCHLGNIAYKTGRRLTWDNATSRFHNDQEANSYLTPVYRKPWELPRL